MKAYIAELQRLARSCDFEHVTSEQLIRDRVIYGLQNDALRDPLLQEEPSLSNGVQKHVRQQSALRHRQET